MGKTSKISSQIVNPLLNPVLKLNGKRKEMAIRTDGRKSASPHRWSDSRLADANASLGNVLLSGFDLGFEFLP